MIRFVRVVGPYTAPVDDAIYLGRTALEMIGASNTQTYPLHFYSAKMSEVRSNYFWCDKEKPDAKFIMEHGKYVKPEYAFLQAISSLSEIPHRHMLVDRVEVCDYPIRMFTVENYIVFYLINENEKSVNIARVLYGRRDWTYLL